MKRVPILVALAFAGLWTALMVKRSQPVGAASESYEVRGTFDSYRDSYRTIEELANERRRS